MYMYICICLYICICMYVYIYVYVHVYVFMYVYIYIFIDVCICTCVYIYICIHIYMYIYIYILLQIIYYILYIYYVLHIYSTSIVELVCYWGHVLQQQALSCLSQSRSMKSSKYNQPHDLDHSPQVDSVGQSLQLLPAGRIQVKRDRMAREVQKHEGLAHQKVLLF